jgi:heat-inducible transcriptional repressor
MVSKIEETGDEVKVYIGSESEIDDNVTVIKTKYKAEGREGTIAIIGPKRMEYERVVNMLEYLKDTIESNRKEIN